jgi:hypothetical protein
MMRYVFKAIDISLSVILLALCTKAFCTHFYLDIKRQLHARNLPTVKDAPSLIPSDEIGPAFAASVFLPKLKVPATRR